MKLFRSIGWTAFAVLTIFSPESVRSECTMSPNSDISCSCIQVAKCDCLCTCSLGKRKIEIGKKQLREQEMMLADYIQAKEGVDKSQLVNLDEVVQKAVEESSQKAGTPVKFMVKVQSDDKSLPKEVEYQIKTSK